MAEDWPRRTWKSLRSAPCHAKRSSKSKGGTRVEISIADHSFKVIVISSAAWKELVHHSLGHVNYWLVSLLPRSLSTSRTWEASLSPELKITVILRDGRSPGEHRQVASSGNCGDDTSLFILLLCLLEIRFFLFLADKSCPLTQSSDLVGGKQSVE